MTFLFWLFFISIGIWCVYEYREELKSKALFKEIERFANDGDDTGTD